MLPVLIGLFAIAQVVTVAGKRDAPLEAETANRQDSSRILLGVGEYVSSSLNLIRSSLIGVFVGILPGVGANIGSVVAYSRSQRHVAHSRAIRFR